MDKDKIIVSVVIDKLALIDRAFDISKTPYEFNELKKVIDGKNQFTRDIDEIDDEGKKEDNTNLFAGIALDTILCDNQELKITKRLKALNDKKNAYLDKLKKTLVYLGKSLLLMVFGVITGCLLTYYSQNAIVLF